MAMIRFQPDGTTESTAMPTKQMMVSKTATNSTYTIRTVISNSLQCARPVLGWVDGIDANAGMRPPATDATAAHAQMRENFA